MEQALKSHVRSKRGYYDGCPERSSRHPSIKVGVGFSQSLFIFFTSTSASDFAIVEPSEKMYMRFACLRVSSSRSNVVGIKCLLQNSLSRNPTVQEPRYQTCHNVARVTQTLILVDSSPSYFHSGAPDLTPQTSDRGGKNKSLCIRPVGELWMHHERGQARSHFHIVSQVETDLPDREHELSTHELVMTSAGKRRRRWFK